MTCNCGKECGRSGCCEGCIDRNNCTYVCQICTPKTVENKPEQRETKHEN